MGDRRKTEDDVPLDDILDEWDKDAATGDFVREWGPLRDALCTVRTLSGREITSRVDTLGNGYSIVVRREDGPWYSIPLERQHSIHMHVAAPASHAAPGACETEPAAMTVTESATGDKAPNCARCGCDPGPYSNTMRCATCGTFVWNTNTAWCACPPGSCATSSTEEGSDTCGAN